jgi:hypothetical protein
LFCFVSSSSSSSSSSSASSSSASGEDQHQQGQDALATQGQDALATLDWQVAKAVFLYPATRCLYPISCVL